MGILGGRLPQLVRWSTVAGLCCSLPLEYRLPPGYSPEVLPRDSTESWIKLADMKESHPVEVAQYGMARGIDKEPALEWCVPNTLKKSQVIISALKLRIRKTTHKYGIEIPTSVEHAFELVWKNGNNLWKDALEIEMYNIGVAFEILEDGKTAPTGYTNISGHLVWYVKMDFTRKAIWVLDSHKTPDPVGSKYAGVVLRECTNCLNLCSLK